MDDYLKVMGIQRWVPRDAVSEASASQDTWEGLAQAASVCRACALCETRTQVVFGVGNRQADLLIVGEAPGYYEDQRGEPFVGRAGQLLNAMLHAIGLSREHIYIANVLKCRPPNNRDPRLEEVHACTPFLKRQIMLLQPKLMVAVGRYAAHFLLGKQDALSRLRTQAHSYEGIPLIVSYHPAYLLRNPIDKAKAWQDWQRVREQLR